MIHGKTCRNIPLEVFDVLHIPAHKFVIFPIYQSFESIPFGCIMSSTSVDLVGSYWRNDDECTEVSVC